MWHDRSAAHMNNYICKCQVCDNENNNNSIKYRTSMLYTKVSRENCRSHEYNKKSLTDLICRPDMTSPTRRLANEYSTHSRRDSMSAPIKSADMTLPMSRQGAPGVLNNLLVLNQRNVSRSTDGSR